MMIALYDNEIEVSGDDLKNMVLTVKGIFTPETATARALGLGMEGTVSDMRIERRAS